MSEQVGLLQRGWVRCLLVFGIWTTLGLVDASHRYFYFHAYVDPDKQQAAWVHLLVGLSDWYVWALLTPLIVWLAHRFPLERCSGIRILLHVFASFASGVVVIAVCMPILLPFAFDPVTDRPMEAKRLFHALIAAKLIFYVITYAAIVVIAQGLVYYRKYRERELRSSQLEAQLAQAQLQMLKMQLHPHFLFNTLHAISTLVHRDADLADRMIARLGELLRTTLDNAGTQEVPLRQELDFIQPYLEIEQARLGPRFGFRLDAAPEVLDALVPNLLLQPLVENAVRHGIAPTRGPARLEVRAWRRDDRVAIEVRDTGAGLPAGWERDLQEGVGLRNTRARLIKLYGDRHSFEVGNHADGGCIIAVSVPFREADEIAGKDEASPTNNETGILSLARQPRPEQTHADAYSHADRG